jgi:hypothetical protein
MERKEVKIGGPLVVNGVTLIPIVSIWLNYWRSKGSILFFSVKQPISIVVASHLEKRVFTLNGEEISLDQLLTEVPEIKEILTKI